MNAQILRRGVFGISVCIPKDWTDQQVIDFVEADSPCGTADGWQPSARTEENCNKRIPCEDREGYMHMVLDA